MNPPEQVWLGWVSWAVHKGLHYDFSYAPSASDIASPSPEFRWSQSCLAVFGELRILLLRAFPALKEIRQSNDPNTPRGVQLYIIKWNFVRTWFVRVRPSFIVYSTTDLLYMCSKQKHKADHGHKKGHAPRAQKGTHPRASPGRALRC